ncbi:putative adhesin [Streptomyces violarus]|uniref:putative adhesin n=1 Tax=Streptomyces violarus TaxID=67380 RepID=UPI003704231E
MTRQDAGTRIRHQDGTTAVRSPVVTVPTVRPEAPTLTIPEGTKRRCTSIPRTVTASAKATAGGSSEATGARDRSRAGTRNARLRARKAAPARSTHGPGDTIPNYTLYHPKGLHIHGNPVQLRTRRGPYDFRGTYAVGLRAEGPAIIDELRELGSVAPGRTVTVEEATLLSALLEPGMGEVHFAACRDVR